MCGVSCGRLRPTADQDQARFARISPGSAGGSVELKTLIDTDGRVSRVDVIGSRDGRAADPALADAAVAAVREWEFTPTHLDGDPIEVTMNVHVTFVRE